MSTTSYKINDNGIIREMNSDEKTTKDAQNKKWNDESATRKITEIKKIRLQKLIETDYLAMSDNTMSEEMKTFRQSMRDLPQNNTTETQYDALLARDDDGNLTNSIWSKP